MERKKAASDLQIAYKPEDYAYSVMWSDDDQVYIGRVAEFASLAAHGTSPALALQEITTVVAYVLEDLREAEEPIPQPLSKRLFSGKLNVRMPAYLHRHLAREAEEQGVSLNQWINLKLSLSITK